MKKLLLSLLMIVVVITMSMVILTGCDKQSINFGGDSGALIDVLGTNSSPYTVATSTATTTVAVNLGGEFEQVTVNLRANASSTPDGFVTNNWFYEFCDVNCSSPTGGQWFSESTKSVSDNMATYQSASSTKEWSAPTGIHGQEFDLLDVNHEWMRVTFYRGDKYENSSVWMYLKPKNL